MFLSQDARSEIHPVAMALRTAAAQIDFLAQRLSDMPIEPAATAKKAGDNLARLLVARIGDERAALAFTSILSATTVEQGSGWRICCTDAIAPSLNALAVPGT